MLDEGFKNYYKVLGLKKGASEAEVKNSYRSLARKFHPDINPKNKNAESKFKDINEAYEILSNAEKRDKYLKYYDFINGFKDKEISEKEKDLNYDKYKNFNDFLKEILGNKSNNYKDNLNAHKIIELSLNEAFNGTVKTLNISGETINVKIPKGIKNNSKLRVKGKGNFSNLSGKRGDLILLINLKRHKIWHLNGNSICGTLPVTFDELALRSVIKVKTLEGETSIKIPELSSHGGSLRLKGKGWPVGNERGDLFLTLKICFPEIWTDKEIKLIKKLKEIRKFQPRDKFN